MNLPVPLIPCCRLLGAAVLSLACLQLSGCAGPRAYEEGNLLLAEGKTEQGLVRLEEAVRAEPRNAEYRIRLATQRAQHINRLTALAERNRLDGRVSDAEKLYQQVLNLDAGHAIARQGLEATVLERRHRQTVSEAEAEFLKGEPPAVATALQMLRPVLAENPAQKDAVNLRTRILDAQARSGRQDPRLAAAFHKPISLQFRDVPLKAVLDLMSQASGLNFIMDKDIRPDLKVTIFVKNNTIEDVLRLVMVTNQLERKVLSENTVLIYPNTPQKLKDYQTLQVRSFYIANGDVKAVAASLKALVKTRDLVVDERLGLILMRDTAEAIRMAERIVALQDLSDPEVMLEVEVLEIKRSRLTELGITWPSRLTLQPLQSGTAPITLSALRNLKPSTTQATVDAASINARKEDQDGNILANPRIRVRNKEKANILIGDRVPVVSTTSTSTGFVSESVNYVDVGLKLDVEPDIYLDREVAIKVKLEVSSLVREVVSKNGTLSYQIGTRGASTVLRLKDGETQILAGLISDEDRSSASKVPGMGELPVLGRLFGTQKDDKQRSEILLSITPRILRALQRPDLQSAEFDSGTESSIGAAPLSLNTVEAPATSPEAAAKGKDVPAGPASTTPAATAPGTRPEVAAAGAAPTASATVALSWQMPLQVKTGEQFSAVLRLSSEQALRGLPLLVGFDPQLLQVQSVQEGDFFRQANGNTRFSQRVDAAQGKLFAALVRQAQTGTDPGVNGSGAALIVNFRAIKPGAARVQVLSANPEPAAGTPLALPVERVIKVVP